MKTEASLHAAKTLGCIASVARNLNRSLESLAEDHPDREQVVGALARARLLIERAHEEALLAVELLERAERKPRAEGAAS